MASRDATKDYTYYTKGIWIEKKQRAYQAWLSYILSPTSAANPSSLNSKRLFAKVRGCVAKVYHKDAGVHAAMLKVEASISNGRLRLLTDGGIMANPRMRKKAMKVLLGYDAFWLKVGLETVFRMTISPKQKGTSNLVASVDEDALQLRSQLTSFIEEHFFSSRELQKKIKKNVKQRKALMEELAAVVLKRFLLLVVLLDRTLTTAELPDCLPLLFDPSSKIKTSADMVRVFLKGSLFGEGDTVKQLEYMGYSLSYQQGVVNEFDYRATDLSKDFRDGIRSCKLAEILLGVPLLKRANFNTASNAVRVYNVKLALSTFAGSDKNVALLNGCHLHPQDIVDGHGETTVGYLWNIALLFQIPKLVTVSALVFEIIQVKIRGRLSLSVAEASKICFPTGYDRRLALLLTWVQTVVSQFGASAKDFCASFADGSVLCYLICHYLPSYMQPDAVYLTKTSENLKEEITHPASSSESEEEPFELDEEDMDLNQFGVYSGKGWMDAKTFKKHKAGILQNFEAVFSVMRGLGGIPETISARDFEDQGPDETAVILYVSHMCARLLQVSCEERAALTIQRMWKIYKGYANPIELIQFEQERKKKQKPRRKARESCGSSGSRFTAYEYRRQRYLTESHSSGSSGGTLFSGFDSTYLYLEPKDLEAVVKLQARVRGVLARRRFSGVKKAVKTLERLQPMIKDRCQYLRERSTVRNAATRIRAEYLRHVSSRSFQAQRAAAVVIQSHWRRHQMQKRYQQMKEAVEILKEQMREMQEKEEAEKKAAAAVCIQAAWKAAVCRERFCQMRSAAVQIQQSFRKYRAEKEAQLQNKAAVIIQSMYRGYTAKAEFQTIRDAAICLQGWFRSRLQRAAFQSLQRSVIVIQAQYRMHQCRMQYLDIQKATICIQSSWKMHTARTTFLSVRGAAICVQSWVRMWLERRHFREVQEAVVIIQSAYRQHHRRNECLAHDRAATTIQAMYRMQVAKKSYDAQRAAALCIQSHWRSRVERKKLEAHHAAARAIQSAFRMQQCRSAFLSYRSAAVQIQRWYRSKINSGETKRDHAATKIQAAWRTYKQVHEFKKLRESVVIIQRAVRLFQKQQWLDDVESRLSAILVDFVSAMEHTHEVVKAAIIIQAYMRGTLVRKKNAMMPREIQNLAREKLAVKKIGMAYRGYKLREKIAEREKAAAVLQKWLPSMKERLQFLKKRDAASKIQRQWRAYQAKREKAAITLQRAFRASKEERQNRRLTAAAVAIQSAWKGHRARTNAPRTVKKAVQRLKSAKRRAEADPSKTLGERCRQACNTVKNNSNVEQTFLALASLEMGTMYSQRCCEDLVSSDALIPLLRVMARCNRSAEHQAAFNRGLKILHHMCKYTGLTIKVFRAAECLDTLSERLQYYRDCPGIYSDIIALFKALLRIPRHRIEMVENAQVIKQFNSLWSLLARKVDTERKYINKLEADKASDKSAKRATEKAYVASHMLVELGDLFEELAMEPADFSKYAHQMVSSPTEGLNAPSTSKQKKKKARKEAEMTFEDWRYEATMWRPKNMIAKEKLSQLRTSGVAPECVLPSAVAQKPVYVNPRERKRLKSLGSDVEAMQLQERTKIRLMSDYKRPPLQRSDSVGPLQSRGRREKRASSMRPSKGNSRSQSVAPSTGSRMPRGVTETIRE